MCGQAGALKIIIRLVVVVFRKDTRNIFVLTLYKYNLIYYRLTVYMYRGAI